MIKSMTGFGRGKYQTEGVDVLIEIKTFNHRYSDVYVKIPRALSFMEDKIREIVGGFISRGKTEIFISYQERNVAASQVYLDKAVAASYVTALNELKNHFDLKEDITVSLVAQFPDVLKLQSTEVDETKLWESIKIPLLEAVDALIAMRKYEGDKLAKNMQARMAEMETLVTQIKQKAPQIPIAYRSKLENRLSEILKQQVVDETRMAMEIAIFADKCNIDEELDRLKIHMEQFLTVLMAEEPVGRKLDFLLQEMNREINTIGSKGNDIGIIKEVVAVKSEIEKIREQIQNIE